MIVAKDPCPMSISGACLKMVEGFFPCKIKNECEYDSGEENDDG